MTVENILVLLAYWQAAKHSSEILKIDILFKQSSTIHAGFLTASSCRTENRIQKHSMQYFECQLRI